MFALSVPLYPIQLFYLNVYYCPPASCVQASTYKLLHGIRAQGFEKNPLPLTRVSTQTKPLTSTLKSIGTWIEEWVVPCQQRILIEATMHLGYTRCISIWLATTIGATWKVSSRVLFWHGKEKLRSQFNRLFPLGIVHLEDVVDNESQRLYYFEDAKQWSCVPQIMDLFGRNYKIRHCCKDLYHRKQIFHLG